MKPIIEVRNLSKRYRVVQGKRYGSLRESLSNRFQASLRSLNIRNRSNSSANESYFWALQDVGFEVQSGEVLGLIGSNGAGKSTLLKILSRITAPTSGNVTLYGRVGSLLEVGTGFHPELSGRDNVFLNGVILGMKRAEIASRFDEIVEFSGVEKFIDTPVKRYSSGMYVRLAFAVAAYLQPEIMLIDEVLAVGDAEFQKKCLGKIGDVARTGRTVIFISHNMTAVESLCDRCLLFRHGQLSMSGAPIEVIEHYLRDAASLRSGSRDLSVRSENGRSHRPLMTRVTLSSGSELATGSVRMNAPLSIAVDFKCPSLIDPVLGVVVKNSIGNAVFGVNNLFIGGYRFADRLKNGSISCSFDRIPLVPGIYFLDLWLNDGTANLDLVHEAISFDVLPADIFGTGQLPPPGTGSVCWPATFSINRSPNEQAYEARA
jgi:lipopolysaccharide transport system ATP-binding protein